jgi:hypothetical protein
MSLAGLGDVDGDGLDDFVVGANGGTSSGGATNAGTAYVFMGQASWEWIAAASAPTDPLQLTADELISRVGVVRPQHVSYASALVANLPTPLLEAAHTPTAQSGVDVDRLFSYSRCHAS